MSDSDAAELRDRVGRLIEGLQERLAMFARESFEADGRGVTLVDIPGLPSGMARVTVSTEMVYHLLDDLCGWRDELPRASQEDTDVLIRMVETYDPTRQAVVMLAFAGKNPVTITMQLERPFVLDEVDGVH